MMAQDQMTDQLKREAEAMEAYLKSRGEPEHVRVGLWAKFLELHKSRTPEQVEKMEAEKGLL